MDKNVIEALCYLERVNQEWAKAIATSAIRGFSYERLLNDFKIVKNALNEQDKKLEEYQEDNKL